MITSLPPQVTKEAIYTSREACQILGIHRNSLRKYVMKQLLHPKRDKLSGRRVFEGRELSRFWFARIN
jgi:DNA-binding transcriptional MerR regulator